jgi:hypothetical protein
LTTVNDNNLNSFLIKMAKKHVPPIKHITIGAIRRGKPESSQNKIKVGSWEWKDGSKWKYGNGQQDKQLKHKDCAEMEVIINGKGK